MNQPVNQPAIASDTTPNTAPGTAPGTASQPGAAGNPDNMAAATGMPIAMQRDAIGLLTEDHRKAQMLFADFALRANAQGDPAEKFAVARQVCGDLLIHMAIEEAIFYPRVREALHED